MIPVSVIETLEQQLTGVSFGKLNLEIVLHDGHAKYRITKEISVVPDSNSSGQMKKDNRTV
jgi:hypothetical protein